MKFVRMRSTWSFECKTKMAEPHHGLIDGQEYNVKIGSSFRQKQKDNFYHTVRYDFKPASVDSRKSSQLTVGENNDITVTVPHVQESESTVFKGSKRPCTKECILIIDKSTGEVTLERLASNVQLKKIRSTNQGLSVSKTVVQPSQSISKISTKPSVHKQRIVSKAETSVKAKEVSPSTLPLRFDQPLVASKPFSRERTMTSSSSQGSDSDSSSSASDTDSDQDDQEAEEQAKALDEALRQEPVTKGNINLIDEDLKLSGSSDSDSD